MVVEADTIVYPRAVVIEALHTSLTDTAMARSIGAHDFTIGTE